MANYYHLPVYRESYRLLVEVYKRTETLGKSHKYTIGEEVKKRAFEVLLNIYRASRHQDKAPYLDKARDDIEYIRLSFRLLRDLGVVGSKNYVALNEHIESVSKQFAAWHKSQNTGH